MKEQAPLFRALTRAGAVWLSFLAAATRFAEPARADSTYVYAVQVTAAVQTAPPQITLNWRADPYGATGYEIYRKAKEDSAWGSPLASLPGSVSSFIDNTAGHKQAYEYAIIKNTGVGYKGYGYIYSGIEVPAIEQRGTLILMVATESTRALDTELARLQTDLIGDGWQVIRHNVSTNDSPQTVKALIMNDYAADPASVNAVFLFGHVPILQSGNINYDGHGLRPMPADAYYGEMHDDWPTNPASSPSYLPSDVSLMVRRVDLANMPGIGAAIPWPSEVELLRNYLNKDHQWRFAQMAVPRRALMGNRRGDEGGLAVAASGYRAFDPLLGPGTTIEANINDTAPSAQRWSSMLSSGGYLWAYGCVGGQDSAIGYLGTHATDYEVWSTDLVGRNAQAVFVMMFGSHLVNWDHTDNIMRAVLATPQTGLASCMSGKPHWFFHHMGLGETIGYSARLTMNNAGLYQNQTNPFPRAIYIALMGDPTLRLDPLPPPTGLSASADESGVHLSWTAGAIPVAEYYLYRANSPTGPFLRLTNTPASWTSFTDVSAAPNSYTYMVRAVALETNSSGTYWNPSEGVLASITVTPPIAPIVVEVNASATQVVVSWNSQAGVSYHVEATPQPGAGGWTNISEQITATGPATSWPDPLTNSALHRFYRVTSP